LVSAFGRRAFDQSTCSLTSSPSSNFWSKSLAFTEFYLLPSGTANRDNSNLIGSTNTHCRPVLVSNYANCKETWFPVDLDWRFKMQMQEDLWLICESGLSRKSFESCHLVDLCHVVRRDPLHDPQVVPERQRSVTQPRAFYTFVQQLPCLFVGDMIFCRKRADDVPGIGQRLPGKDGVPFWVNLIGN
jgi:hypothetical protein